ncbi:MAG: intradiol ring-cleavage dioxygenase [Pseudomonadota bacterium]
MTKEIDLMTLTEGNSADVVIARNATAGNQRLADCANIMVKHLHAAVKEMEPTQEEWMAMIQFLTDTGHMCNDWRQEFILLSDVLGVSMLVDAIVNRKPSGATQSTVLGPFFREGAPVLDHGSDICLDGKGEPLVVQSRVLNVDGDPIVGATINVWQANEDGFYDVQQEEVQPAYNLRGCFKTDDEGRYWFKGVIPKYYSIPNDGPVGKLLDALGRHPWRPSHLHFMIEAEGYDRLITHLFDRNDPYLATDAVFGVKEELIVDYSRIDDPKEIERYGYDNSFYFIDYNFVLTS